MPAVTAAEGRALLDAAGAAPSIGNRQPWRFEVAADRVEVWVDRAGGLPAVDPDGRQLLISCGAAVFNLRVAWRHLGHHSEVALLPDPDDGDHVATVVRGRAMASTAEDRSRYDMLRFRHTNRGPYRPVPVPAPVRRRLVAAADRESAVLHVVDRPDLLAAVAALVATGYDIQAGRADVRAEFLHTLREVEEPASGMPLRSWRQVPYPLPVLDGRDRLTATERPRLADFIAGSTVAVLCTGTDDAVDQVRAGQALQRTLLTATAAGVAVSYLNQPIEDPALRQQLGGLFSDQAVPQLLLRLGYAVRPSIPVGRRG